ncbi:MAG: hypothetical protein J0M12_12775 [Deltaproteobacteria bacterium]|nr:hypothetical protein [Deltaproteobacteria bacterium]
MVGASTAVTGADTGFSLASGVDLHGAAFAPEACVDRALLRLAHEKAQLGLTFQRCLPGSNCSGDASPELRSSTYASLREPKQPMLGYTLNCRSSESGKVMFFIGTPHGDLKIESDQACRQLHVSDLRNEISIFLNESGLIQRLKIRGENRLTLSDDAEMQEVAVTMDRMAEGLLRANQIVRWTFHGFASEARRAALNS